MINEDFTLICTAEHGRKRLSFMAPKRYAKFVESLGEGQELRCKFTDPVRGIKRNNKLHGLLDEGAEVLGWEDRTEFKEQVLLRLRPDGFDEITGFPRRKKTRHMSDEEIDQLCVEFKAFVQHLMPGYIFRYDFELQPEPSRHRVENKLKVL